MASIFLTPFSSSTIHCYSNGQVDVLYGSGWTYCALWPTYSYTSLFPFRCGLKFQWTILHFFFARIIRKCHKSLMVWSYLQHRACILGNFFNLMITRCKQAKSFALTKQTKWTHLACFRLLNPQAYHFLLLYVVVFKVKWPILLWILNGLYKRYNT